MPKASLANDLQPPLDSMEALVQRVDRRLLPRDILRCPRFVAPNPGDGRLQTVDAMLDVAEFRVHLRLQGRDLISQRAELLQNQVLDIICYGNLGQ